MKHIFCIIGKTASGKDTIYESLLEDSSLGLAPMVPWTTRPKRAGELEGVEYHFTDDAGFQKLVSEGRVIEHRTYNTILGPWTYFTVNDAAASCDLLLTGTLEMYVKIRDYYGKDHVIPVYVEVEDGLRLQRALKRELKPGNQKYDEMCRRFLSDQKDYSEENLRRAGISRRFQNNGERGECIREIASFIRTIKEN